MHIKATIASLLLLLPATTAFGAAERTPVADPVTPPAPVAGVPLDTIDDGGFEAGTPNPFWTESSTNFGTPLCDEANCGLGTGTGPASGTFWVWFGGVSAPEEGAVSQDVEISNGSATVDFMLEIPVASGNGTDFVELLVDGTQVWSALENAAGFATYAPVSVDISAFADGGVHTIEFHSVITGAPSGTNFFVDDVALTVTPDDGGGGGGGGGTDGGFTPEVPTLDQAGLAVLLLLLAGAGVVFLRRRA